MFLLAKHAKDIAQRWVREEANALPGFAGAFFHGSINWLPDDALLPETSDLDVMVVLDEAEPPEKPGKFRYRDVMLEVSYLPSAQLGSAEQVLGQYNLAGSFHTASVIADPGGWLSELQQAVARNYAKRAWVRRRCEQARDKVLTGFRLHESDPFPAQVTAWLFPTGVTTHILLVAGLKNPTVRTRYLAVRELLAEYGQLAFYEPLLELLGCAQMSRVQVEGHLAALAEAFDVAKTVVKTPFFFASDINDIARPIAIDGSHELIARGDHREAIFWMVATYSRCQMILQRDAPLPVYERFDRGYRALLADLGIVSFADLQRRHEEVKYFLPRVWEVAEAIMAANPEIEDE